MNTKNMIKLVHIAIVGICFCTIQTSLAEDTESKEVSNKDFYVKAFGGLNFLRDAELESSGTSPLPEGDASFDNGMNVGLAVGYKLIEELAFELEYSYRSNDINKIKNESGNFATSGDLASVAIMANALYYPKLSKSFFPYFGGGIGFLQEIDSDVKFSNNQDVTDLEDSTLALQLIAGIEIPILESVTVFGEGRYLAAPGPDLSNGNQGYDLDYNSFSTNVGLKYSF